MKAKMLLAGVLTGLVLSGCSDDGAEADRQAARQAAEQQRKALERRRESARQEVANASKALEKLRASRDDLKPKSAEALALAATVAAIDNWASVRTS